MKHLPKVTGTEDPPKFNFDLIEMLRKYRDLHEEINRSIVSKLFRRSTLHRIRVVLWVILSLFLLVGIAFLIPDLIFAIIENESDPISFLEKYALIRVFWGLSGLAFIFALLLFLLNLFVKQNIRSRYALSEFSDLLTSMMDQVEHGREVESLNENDLEIVRDENK